MGDVLQQVNGQGSEPLDSQGSEPLDSKGRAVNHWQRANIGQYSKTIILVGG